MLNPLEQQCTGAVDLQIPLPPDEANGIHEDIVQSGGMSHAGIESISVQKKGHAEVVLNVRAKVDSLPRLTFIYQVIQNAIQARRPAIAEALT